MLMVIEIGLRLLTGLQGRAARNPTLTALLQSDLYSLTSLLVRLALDLESLSAQKEPLRESLPLGSPVGLWNKGTLLAVLFFSKNMAGPDTFCTVGHSERGRFFIWLILKGMCSVYMCVPVHSLLSAVPEAVRRGRGTPGAEGSRGRGHLMWVLGSEAWCSARAAFVLSCRAVSPAPSTGF